MRSSEPSFTLIVESHTSSQQPGWSFVLQTADKQEFMAAEDREIGLSQERLELLAVIRGLEALEQPSRVTILTASQYVRRGLAYGLEEWRSNGWTWEHFGQMVLVKNHDLWQRLDRALAIHQVECRRWRFDPAHEQNMSPKMRESAQASQKNSHPVLVGGCLGLAVSRAGDGFRLSLSCTTLTSAVCGNPKNLNANILDEHYGKPDN